MERYKRYLIGGLFIFLQYLIIRIVSINLNIPISLRNISFFINIFLYLKEDIYSFKTCLIWEELKKQLKCYGEYVILISIIVFHTQNFLELWKYIYLGTIFLIGSLILAKFIRFILYNYMKKNVVIVGIGNLANELFEVICQNKFTMYNVLGFVDIKKEKDIKINKEKILGNRESLEKLVDSSSVDEIIIAISEISDVDVNYVLDNVYSKVKKVKIIPTVNRVFTITPIVEDYDNIMILVSKNLNLSKKRKILKRVIDFIIGLVGCIILIPLTVVVWIKTDRIERKKGVFFTQDRLGKNGKKIKIYKYRSMVTDAEKQLENMLKNNSAIREEYQKNKKIKNDPRITKIGQFLRRTSLDEFPQFINILKGEMSFVGPRPYLFNEINDMGSSYNKIIELYPGITGMWQAHGRSDIDFKGRLLLDEHYHRNWSIWLDIVIIIKTIKNVINRKGAY